MLTEQFLELCIELEQGAVYYCPFSTALFPDTEAIKTELCFVAPSSLLLTTYFREFAPGHGWSVEQKEEEWYSYEAFEEKCRYFTRDRFVKKG